MNRLYKYLIILIGIVLLAPLRLQAASIKIDNVTLDSKSENVTILSEPEIDGFDINLNYKFVNKEDYIKYKIVIKNKDKIDYVVKENDNDSEYVEYELDNNRIKAKGTTTIYLTIKYKKFAPFSSMLLYISCPAKL